MLLAEEKFDENGFSLFFEWAAFFAVWTTRQYNSSFLVKMVKSEFEKIMLASVRNDMA